jgi:hypothetical protein
MPSQVDAGTAARALEFSFDTILGSISRDSRPAREPRAARASRALAGIERTACEISRRRSRFAHSPQIRTPKRLVI